MNKVIVVCGGQSDEREVSLRSGNAVAKALKTAGYEVTVLDTSDTDERIGACDVVFPVLHGVGGEDGQFQLRLESMGARFVGSGSVASRLCMDKEVYREQMQNAGFLMADGAALNLEEYRNHPLSKVPHVVKPIDGGSTIDTIIVRDLADTKTALIEECFNRHGRMLVEQLIVGDEITVAVLGEEVMPVIEIIPPQDGEFDYENKYNGKSQELCPPLNISGEIQTRARDLALKVHKATGCRDLSRTDFMINSAGELYLLETNTIPGLTEQSLYPNAAAVGGYPMPKLVDYFIKAALARN